MKKKISTITAVLAIAVALPALADTTPSSIFDELPTPNHLRQVEDPDTFLNYHKRTFVQVASFRRQEGAYEVATNLRKRGFSPVVYRYQSRRQTLFVTMIMVTSRDQLRKTLAGVRRMGYRDAFTRNYRVPR